MGASGAAPNVTCEPEGTGRAPSMTMGGIGPKLALLCLPYVILSLLLRRRNPGFGDLKVLNRRTVRILGLLWLGIGFVFWAYSGVYFLTHFRSGKLLRKGPYGLCRNPLYSSLIMFVVPSLALINHSGLVGSISLVLYLGFKISIHGETTLLRQAFGEEYEEYEKSVNELVPFPSRLLRSAR